MELKLSTLPVLFSHHPECPNYPTKHTWNTFICAGALLFHHGKIKLVGLPCVPRGNNAAILFVPLVL